MTKMFDFTDKKIMVTGASSGIGRATAVLLDSLGAELVLCDRDEENLQKVVAELSHARGIPFDLLSFDDYDGLFSQAVSEGKKLNGLVHCAGIVSVTPLKIMQPQLIHNIMDINLTSFMMLCSSYSKRKYSIGGSIVGISAANAHTPQKCMSVYAASKAAVEASVKTMALELAKSNIRINCIAPGAVNTPMSQNTDEETLKKIVSRQLLGMCEPSQIASVAAFLLSEASSAITGRTVFADGGMLGQTAD